MIMDKYVLTLEWWEGDYIGPNFPRYHVHPYGKVSNKEMEQIRSFMERYSPYDYCDLMSFDDKQDYDYEIFHLKGTGAIIEEK